MATMPEMLNELTEREKERLSSEQEAQAGIRALKEKVSSAAEELLKLRRAQDHEIGVVKAQYEKRIRDTAYASRQRVRKAEVELANAEAQKELSERGLAGAEAEVAALQRRLAQLQAHFSERHAAGESRLEDLRLSMDDRIARVQAQANTRAGSMAEHRDKVRRSCMDALNTVQEELTDQLSRASVRAEGRTRFRELCDLANRCAGYEMTQDSYKELKGELIGLWQLQKSMKSPPSPVLVDRSVVASDVTIYQVPGSPDGHQQRVAF